MLSQVIYVSVRKASCTDEEIQKILEASNRKNGERDISGVLLYSKSKFLQVLEGEKDEIMELYDKIKADERHTNVIMISLRPIKERYFPSWQMGSKKIDDSYDFLTDMDEQSKKEFKKILEGEQTNDAIRIINKLF